MNCPHCGLETFTKPNGVHLEERCPTCGYIRNVRQPIEKYCMPIGKYKGKLLSEIQLTDYQYLEWASANMHNKIGDRVREYMSKTELAAKKLAHDTF